MRHSPFQRRLLWFVPALGLTLMVLAMPFMLATPFTPQVTALSGDTPRDPPMADWRFSASERFYARQLYRLYVHDAASRLNVPELSGMSDNAFASMIVAKLLIEDATIYADRQPIGLLRQLATLPPTAANRELRKWSEDAFYQGEISWGPANLAYPNAEAGLLWWESNAPELRHRVSDVRTAYYSIERSRSQSLAIWNGETDILWELQTGQGAVELLALSILRSADRARQYYRASGQPVHPLSAYSVAMGLQAYTATNDKLYRLENWTSKGFYYEWIDVMDNTARLLGMDLGIPDDYLPYTMEERELLDRLPPG
jgi:hypothetical protein